MLIYTFSRMFNISWRIAEDKLAYLICFTGRGGVLQGTECRARGLFKKKFQEAGILRTTPTFIPHSVNKFSYYFIIVKTSIIFIVKVFKVSIH